MNARSIEKIYAVSLQVMEVWNNTLFYLINNAARSNTALDHFFVSATVWWLYVIIGLVLLVPLIIFLCSKDSHRKFTALRIWIVYLLSLSFTWTLVEFLKGLFPSARPSEILQNFHALVPYSTMDAFPSMHTALAFTVAVATYYWSRTWGSIMIFFATMIGISRIYVGAHFPNQVLVGALIGGVLAYLFVQFFSRYMQHSNS